MVSPLPQIQLFSLNSNIGGPHSSNSQDQLLREQMEWLKSSLASSRAAFKLVYFHHPILTTARHDPPAVWMDFDYESWGASGVFTGHQHVYERMYRSENATMPYIVNGLGGHQWVYDIHDCATQTGSVIRYNSYHGAMYGVLSEQPSDAGADADLQIDLCFYSIENNGKLIDHVTLQND